MRAQRAAARQVSSERAAQSTRVPLSMWRRTLLDGPRPQCDLRLTPQKDLFRALHSPASDSSRLVHCVDLRFEDNDRSGQQGMAEPLLAASVAYQKRPGSLALTKPDPKGKRTQLLLWTPDGAAGTEGQLRIDVGTLKCTLRSLGA